MSHGLIDRTAEALRLHAPGRPAHTPAVEAGGVVGRLLRRRAVARGLDESQFEALLQLRAARGARLTVAELGGSLGQGPGLVEVVSGLLAEGLMESAGHGARELGLSEKGRRLADQVVAEVWVLLAHALRPAGLTPAQLIARFERS